VTDELHYRVFKLLEAQPDLSQRQLSKELGVSLGKANYCLKAMLDKGWIKANNFKNSQHKIAYIYLLTPKGLERKVKAYLAISLTENGGIRTAQTRDPQAA
jgi:EPS-associated MarR family transcriptional regulator